ncbi:MAG: hypothetical protein GY929_18825 [Actinomycetia bacterium]|nr:hypothetical protein [Actinomycetes bacterium]
MSGNGQDTEPVELDLGFDRFRAELAASACRAAGYAVEVRFMDENGLVPGPAAGVPNRLVAHRQDFQAVTSIVHQTLPGADLDGHHTPWRNRVTASRPATTFIVAIMVLAILVPLALATLAHLS